MPLAAPALGPGLDESAMPLNLVRLADSLRPITDEVGTATTAIPDEGSWLPEQHIPERARARGASILVEV